MSLNRVPLVILSMRRPCSLTGVAWTSAEFDAPADASKVNTTDNNKKKAAGRSFEGILNVPRTSER
jgi:hypothetical protein